MGNISATTNISNYFVPNHRIHASQKYFPYKILTSGCANWRSSEKETARECKNL